MSRNVLAIAIVLMSTGCVTHELVWCSSGPPILSRFGSSNARAFEVLKLAERLESSHVGEGGTPSCYVAAYRHLVAQRHAAVRFRRLFEQSAPVGRIYALAGLYETDRAEFLRLVDTTEASSPAMFERTMPAQVRP